MPRTALKGGDLLGHGFVRRCGQSGGALGFQLADQLQDQHKPAA
jgi:hypothetical protein